MWSGLALFGTCSFGQAPVSRPEVPVNRSDMRSLRPTARSGSAIHSRAAARPVVAPPVVPSGPLQQVPMAQLPSTPPQVTYQNGMLTIVAQNSSLGDILHEVHRRTGATIDVPPTATERVVTRIGPGPAREVLVTLLNGAGYNYVMMGTASDSAALASVILTSKPTGSTGGGPVTTAYQPPTQYVGQQPMAPGMGPGGPVVQPAPPDEEADAAEEKDEEDPADQEQAQDQTGNGTATAQDGSQPNAGPKTPEQILEMLRQRQQQPPQPGPPVPGQQVIVPPNSQPPENE
jgi:hypothetical protein